MYTTTQKKKSHKKHVYGNNADLVSIYKFTNYL